MACNLTIPLHPVDYAKGNWPQHPPRYDPPMTTATAPSPDFGPMLRLWRNRRSLSQLALSADSEISQRHLSFIESGRSRPSREMVLRLAETLSIPLRDRNALLVAAGFAPAYRERPADDPESAAAHQAVQLILKHHEPFPALAIDRHWTMLHANAGITALLDGIDPALLEPPVNALRLTLHPGGLAPRIENFREWRTHVFHRLNGLIDQTADPGLVTLLEELKSYPVPPGAAPYRPGDMIHPAGIAIPFHLRTEAGTLSFLSTTTVFGTALDIALSECAIETFLPADARTAARLMPGS